VPGAGGRLPGRCGLIEEVESAECLLQTLSGLASVASSRPANDARHYRQARKNQLQVTDYYDPRFRGSSGLAVGFLFGSIIDYQNQVIYPSYEIVASSPGAELLQNYGLQQTECGPPNLVVLGTRRKRDRAYPNNLARPGNYEVDPTTLTSVSRLSP
jgi:hypothetical protein